MQEELRQRLSLILQEMGEDYQETMGLLEELTTEGLRPGRADSLLSGLLVSACRLHRHTYSLQELLALRNCGKGGALPDGGFTLEVPVARPSGRV